MTSTWATVSALSPLTVNRDGETVDIPAESLVSGLTVGARVRIELTGGPAVIHGRVNGGDPTGTIVQFAGSTVPSGYAPCDGASLVQADYAALFAAIGTTYGSVDGTHFNVPSIPSGQVIVETGTKVITPVANTPTVGAVTLTSGRFPSAPTVMLTGHTAAPGTVLRGVATDSITASGFNIYVTRTNTTDTTVNWVATLVIPTNPQFIIKT